MALQSRAGLRLTGFPGSFPQQGGGGNIVAAALLFRLRASRLVRQQPVIRPLCPSTNGRWKCRKWGVFTQVTWQLKRGNSGSFINGIIFCEGAGRSGKDLNYECHFSSFCIAVRCLGGRHRILAAVQTYSKDPLYRNRGKRGCLL